MQYQDPSFKKFIDSLKESNKNLKAIVENTDSQKKKEERKNLEELVSHNKKDLALQLTQTKLEQDIVKDEDKGDELLQDIKDVLTEIKDSFNQPTKSSPVVGTSGNSNLVTSRLGEMNWTNRTFGEDIRTAVAGTKKMGSSIKSGFSTAVNALKSPGNTIRSAIGSAKDIGKGIVTSAKAGAANLKDIAGTSANYDAERERFNKEFEQSDVAKAYMPRDEQGKFVTYKKEGKGRVAYDLAKAAQDRSDVEDRKSRSSLIKSTQGKSSNKVSFLQPESKAGSDTGAISEIAKNNVTLGKLLSVTQEQLTNVKAIKDAIASKESKDVESSSTPSIDTSIDLGGKAGKGIGGKILGGVGKAARILGPAAAIAGAAYSGFEGYKNTGTNFDLKEGQEATTGQKVSSTLGGVASGLTFGLLDEKTASQGIHKAGSAIGSLFSPSTTVPTVGNEVAKTSAENADMGRMASSGGQGGTIVSNNVSTNNTTKYVPIKSTVRPETQGSALDRYQNRIAVY